MREGLARNLKLVKKRIESYGPHPSTMMKRDKTDSKSEKPVSRYHNGRGRYRPGEGHALHATKRCVNCGFNVA